MFNQIVLNRFSQISIFIFLIFIPNISYVKSEPQPAPGFTYKDVHNWAMKIGNDLNASSTILTRKKNLTHNFKKFSVTEREGKTILFEMEKDLKNLFQAKISAVERIVDSAEMNAESSKNDKVDLTFSYYNAKEMVRTGEKIPEFRKLDFFENQPVTKYIQAKEITLNRSRHFFDMDINTSVSSVHVPDNIFDRDPDVIKAIQWSESLDAIFRSNYEKDPTLSFQFFGSATGFMRQFPATQWDQIERDNESRVDLYDCRLRTWYINAANSPKDIIILIDISGSMTGLKKDIARHTVHMILDTLGTNDFVNIFTFNSEIVEIVPCFNDTLVQATMENIRELKLFLDFNTTEIANFTASLTKAFDILERNRNETCGSLCNQAIMLVSDGVPFYYKEFFEQYNWMNDTEIPVRIFTYLIGREGAEVKQIKWIACNNRGYYVHLSTMFEVREQVLNYIAVMARPLVLHGREHPAVWTDVYADVVDPKMTDYLWSIKERDEQKTLILAERVNKKLFHSPEEQYRRSFEKLKQNQIQSTISTKYIFMTTVSMPVFDRSENATRIANLLGVAGTDVPLADIRRILSHFSLGVHGYAFIVTNNGHILMHPDLRPVFGKEEILKPSYNSIDFAEIELVDDDAPARIFNEELLKIRELMINKISSTGWLMVKQHTDEMRRVSRFNRTYHWTSIENTPFTLAITYPSHLGKYRLVVKSDEEIHRLTMKNAKLSKAFIGDKWRVHPEWLYCKDGTLEFISLENELRHFVDKMEKPGWKWPESRAKLPPDHPIISNTSSGRSSFSEKGSYYCDRSLMQAVVVDAFETEWFNLNNFNSKEFKHEGTTMFEKYGVFVTFMATHSGLTRWFDYVDNGPPHDFGIRAIEETWYKRAIEYHYVDPTAFVFSIPLDRGFTNETLLTVSHAIFVQEGGKSIPAAVTGYQSLFSTFFAFIKSVMTNCSDSSNKCVSNCDSDNIDCYVIDDNGYVLVGNESDTGKFFGEINAPYMKRMVDEGIFTQVSIYDYQAVCFIPTDSNSLNSLASILATPFVYLFQLLKGIVRYLFIFLLHCVNAYDTYTGGDGEVYVVYDTEPTESYNMPASRQREREFDKRVVINKTQPTSCDQNITLYQLQRSALNEIWADGCEQPYAIIAIPHTNLILLVIDRLCPFAGDSIALTTMPVEIDYGNSLPCYKSAASLTRVRPASCINKHINESHIELCGNGNKISNNIWMITITFILIKLSAYKV